MNRLFGLGLTLAVAVLCVASVAQARELLAEVTYEVEECQVKVEAEAVPVSADPVILRAVFSQAIGEELAAELQEESGVEVVGIERESEEPLAIRLTLDTSNAAAGEWALALRGENGTCTGKVTVRPANEEDV